MLTRDLVFWPGIRGSVCISQRIYAFHSLGQILVYEYTDRQHGQILITCTIPIRSHFPPSHVYSRIHFVSLGSIHLLM